MNPTPKLETGNSQLETRNQMIKVLIVEDSAVVRELLIHILTSDPDVQVIGTASDGEEAIKALERDKPNVLTMDINMPKMDGLEATRRIMETHPTPIVIVSGRSDTREVATTFRAMEAGALAVVQRPMGLGHPDHETTAGELVQTVKLMSEVKVVRRWGRPRRGAAVSKPPLTEVRRMPVKFELVVIGASTGGPVALQTILSRLPKDFAMPVLIVQHMAPGFVTGFADWLAQTCELPIQIATQGAHLLPGHAYVAPDGLQMKVQPGGKILLTTEEAENGLRPSVSYLFRSVADVYGAGAIGVLLTGMGKDGAAELKWLKDRGAVTLTQDKASSVIHGMPGEAIRLDAATYVLPPDGIAAALTDLANRRSRDVNPVHDQPASNLMSKETETHL